MLRPRRGHAGIVMLIVLIALVIMTLAAIGLTRTVSTSSSVAGNLAFEQAAATSADQAVEAAVAWLEQNSTSLTADVPASGYAAARVDPLASSSDRATWADLWTLLAKTYTPVALGTDGAGNTASYLIQRMCASAGEASSANGCSRSPASEGQSGSGHGGASQAITSGLTASAAVYYRITIKVSGPRNTVSYVQAMVAL